MSDNKLQAWVIGILFLSFLTFCDGKNDKNLHDALIETLLHVRKD